MTKWSDFAIMALLFSLNSYAAHGISAKVVFSGGMLVCILASLALLCSKEK